MKKPMCFGAALALLMIGCGGGGGGSTSGRGQISGVVFDGNGNPVREATVSVGSRSTLTNSAGSYVLENMPAEDVTVRAEVRDRNNVRYFGQNLARVFDNERANNVNITVYLASSLVRLNGQVRDGRGNVVRSARVYARPTDGNVLSSASALTDRDGVYVISGLAAGVEYQLVATALGYGEQSDSISITTGEDRRDFVLGNPSNPSLAAPAGLDAVAYTTPFIDTRSVRAVGTRTQRAEAYEALKQLLDPTRATRKASKKQTRDTALGNRIEVDLTWDPYTAVDTLGFGVYRAVPPSTSDVVQFLDDPLSELYADADPVLRENVTYDYAITALSTSYNEQNGAGESPFSDSVLVTPLGDLLLNLPTGATLRWNSVSGVSQYRVYVYDVVPKIGVTPVYQSADGAVTGTSFTVPGLTTGRTYYYIIVGENADGSARTFSDIDFFNP